MSNSRDDLHRLAEELPEDLAGEVVDFARFLCSKRGRTDVMRPEDEAWLRAGLDAAAAGIKAIESETPQAQVAAWLHALDEHATPIIWDDASGEFVEVAK